MGNLFFDEPAGSRPPTKFKAGDWIVWEREFTPQYIGRDIHVNSVYLVTHIDGDRYGLASYYGPNQGAYLFDDIDTIYRVWDGALENGKPVLRRARSEGAA